MFAVGILRKKTAQQVISNRKPFFFSLFLALPLFVITFQSLFPLQLPLQFLSIVGIPPLSFSGAPFPAGCPPEMPLVGGKWGKKTRREGRMKGLSWMSGLSVGDQHYYIPPFLGIQFATGQRIVTMKNVRFVWHPFHGSVM